MNKKGQLIVVSGPSGVGKGTVLKEYLSAGSNTVYSVSATTRQPRPGEENGVHYYFLTKEEFEHTAQQGGMLEYASYNGNYYGTPKEPVERQREQGNDVILEIEVQGALQVKLSGCFAYFYCTSKLFRAGKPPDRQTYRGQQNGGKPPEYRKTGAEMRGRI